MPMLVRCTIWWPPTVGMFGRAAVVSVSMRAKKAYQAPQTEKPIELEPSYMIGCLNQPIMSRSGTG